MTRSAENEACAQRLRLALDLYETGEKIMREGLKRRHADATPAQIDARLRAWLSHRPGAEAGDAAGRPAHHLFR